MDNLLTLSLAELRKKLHDRETSSAELTAACLDRIEKRASLNCFIEVFKELALHEAKKADSLIAQGVEDKPLLGIPVAAKDLLATLNGNTTCASRFLENYSSPFEATLISRLRAAGAIIIGKTNMDEFAMGSSNENSHFGPVKNPWNEELVPGGSSGGSAACVADCQVPAAIGTDTGGSIRQPSALCGVTGIKPTYGRISRYGMVAFASSLDQAGPIARSAEDCAIITEAMAGVDPLDGTSVAKDVPNWHDNLNSDLKGLKIGIPAEYFIDGLSTEVESAVQAAIAQLRNLGAEIIELSLPHTAAAIDVYYILAPAEASSNLGRFDGARYGRRADDVSSLQEMYFRSRSEGFGKEVIRRILIGTYVLSTGYYDAYYLRAQKVRTLICQDFANAFESKCDVIACPTTPTPAFKIGENADDPLQMYLNDVFTVPVNLAGLPAMSLPCGLSSAGLPLGLQLIGKPWDEQSLFNVGHAYQQQTDWHRKTPQGAIS